MALTCKGDDDFLDLYTPVPGKSEWGMDTLTRRMIGYIDGLESFINGLDQGDTFTYNGHVFYLQTWENDDHPYKPTVTLNYKGLVEGIPDPTSIDDMSIQSVNISADFDPPVTVGKETVRWIDASGTLQYLTSDVKASSATREIEFYSPQTTWRYIRGSRPVFSTYNSVNGREPIVIRSVTRLDNGRVYTGNVAVAVASALGRVASNKVVGPNATPVHGTPYFECQDVVQRGFWP